MMTRRDFSFGLASATVLCGTALPILRLEKTIPLPGVRGRIDHFSADTRRGRLFVAALGNGSVEVVDWKGGKILHTISGLEEPQGLLYLPEVNRLYVATGGDGSLRIYEATGDATGDGTGFQQLKDVRLWSDADNVRFDPVAKHVYVGYGQGALAALDLDGNRKGSIAMKGHPESFQMERNRSRLYVNVPDSQHIVVADREKRAVIGRWNTGDASANFPMALDEQGRRLFVVCRRPARLLVLDADSGHIVQSLEAVGDADDIFFDEAHHQLYVTGGEGAVSVYSEETPGRYKQGARIATAAGARTSLFVPEWSRLFIAAPYRNPSQTARLLAYAIA